MTHVLPTRTSMRHFPAQADDHRLFARPPQPFSADADRTTLATALGATLYTPGTRTSYTAELPRLMALGVTSAVLCLEDAIADDAQEAAERNVVTQLRRIDDEGLAAPLLFVRVRSPEQLARVAAATGPALTGFVLPKFTAASGPAWFSALATGGRALLAMPVLEGPEVAYAETRIAELLAVRAVLAAHRDDVLAVRVGGTDVCGLFGLRRGRDLTIYDVGLARGVIADIVNVLTRDPDVLVTGVVWEHFTRGARLLKPLLRTAPFDDVEDGSELRDELVRADLDGLIREVLLDRANGLTGKTVIHPDHVRAVHALAAVTAAEHEDACAVLTSAGGATASPSGTGMVEAKPHARWAAAVLRRAEVFGVLQPGRGFADLLA